MERMTGNADFAVGRRKKVCRNHVSGASFFSCAALNSRTSSTLAGRGQTQSRPRSQLYDDPAATGIRGITSVVFEIFTCWSKEKASVAVTSIAQGSSVHPGQLARG